MVGLTSSVSEQQTEFVKEVHAFKSRHPLAQKAARDIHDMHAVKLAMSRTKPPRHDRYSLWKLLPGKPQVDELVQLYLDSLENIYHVLHVPSFLKRYDEFWQQPADSHTNSPMIALILLMVACVACVDEPAELQFVGVTAAQRSKMVTVIIAVDDWIQNRSHKYLTLEYFQVRCILLVAKTIIGVHLKRWYQDIGSLLRQGMSIGLHLEVEGSKIGAIISDFDKEMRRRIWAAICELEITICLLRGLPSCLQGLQVTCRSPSLIFDDQLACPATGHLDEQSQPPYKRIRYLVHMSRHSALRLDLVHRVNGSTFDGNLEELLRLEDETMAACRQYDFDHPGAGPSAIHIAKTYFKLEFLRLLLFINRRAAVRSKSERVRKWATFRCTDLASQIIREHQDVDERTRMLLTYLHMPAYTAAISLSLDLAVMIRCKTESY